MPHPSVTPDLALFHAIFATSPSPIWILDFNAIVIEANNVALEMMRISEERVRGNPFATELWLNDSQSYLLQSAFEQCLVSSEPYKIAVPFSLAHTPWIEFTFRLLAPIQAVVASGRLMEKGPTEDQVALIQSEQALRDSQQALLASTQELVRQQESQLEMQRLTQSGSWSWQRGEVGFQWSDSLVAIFGMERTAPPITLDTFLGAIHPDDKGLFYQGFEHLASQDFYIRIIRPSGEVRFLYGIWRVERDSHHEIVTAFGTCQDITNQHRQDEDLAQKVHQISTLNTIAQLMASSNAELDIYSHAITILRNLVGAQSMAIFLQNPLQVFVQHHTQPYAIAIDSPLLADSPLMDQVWHMGTAVHISTYEQDERLKANGELVHLLGYTPQSLIMVPLWWRSAHRGALVVFHPNAHHFNNDDIHLVQTVGVWLTIALLNLQLLEEQRHARHIAEQQRERVESLMRNLVNAQEAERQRIARELHDEAGQALVVVKMQLSAAKRRPSAEQTSAHLEEAIQLTSETMENIRRLAYNLLPPSLNKVGMVETLQGLCRDYRRRTGLAVTYEGDSVAPALSEEATLTLYRFVQEALTNIVKYAEAETVLVALTHKMGDLTVSVTDDGRGFDPTTMVQGMGLTGMTERLRLIGGTLTLYSALGEGTTATASIAMALAQLV